jgi:acyl carrier protein
MADQQVVIVDPEAMTRCAADRVGEIWVSGPSVARGYFRRDAESEGVFRARLADSLARFLRTGDLGFIHDGELFVTGRRKDLCIIRGRNIYPQDVEATVSGCDDALLSDAGAVFTVDQDGTEQLVILHEVKPSRLAELDPEPVFRAIVGAVIEQHEVKPTAVVLLRPGGILRTSSGKVQRHACREAYLAKQLPVVAEKQYPPGTCISLGASASLEELLDFITRWLDLPAGELKLDQRLDGLPIDSLKAFELKVLLEEAYQVKLPLTAFAQSPTLRDFVALLGVPVGEERSSP